jgi:hypothetical protein
MLRGFYNVARRTISDDNIFEKNLTFRPGTDAIKKFTPSLGIGVRS